MSVPQGVHIGAVGHEKLHHRDAISIERGSHEGAVAPLVHVRSVRDHPFRHGESHKTRRLPWHAAFGNPRERPIFSVTQWSTVQRRVARHHGLDANTVIGVNRLLELPDLLEGLYVSLELRQAGKPVEARDLELRIGDRCRRAGLEQILGLVLQMAEIGAVGETAWLRLRVTRHSDLLSSKCPLSAHRAERRLRRLDADRWASTLSAYRMRPLREGDPIIFAPRSAKPARVKGWTTPPSHRRR